MFYAFEQDTTPLYTTAKNVFTQEECSKIIEIGKSLNLNPYDQPAVELIKVETKRILT